MTPGLIELLPTLKAQLTFLELRTASATYFEGVLSREQLPACEVLLASALGAPLKPFGQPPKLERKARQAVDRLGGVRQEQCLYLQAGQGAAAAYALLWPWASDANRVTLKVGTCTL